MTTTFFISDLHFGHTSTWAKFKKLDGSPLRPFSSNEEMNETMISNWNKVVGPKDLVFVVGDVTMSAKYLHLVGRANGRKKLIAGNHDEKRTEDYLQYFEKVLGCTEKDGFICTHIPVHPSQFGRFKGNIHGHLHDKVVLDNFGKPDKRYFNVSVERLDFTPISFDQIRKHFGER